MLKALWSRLFGGGTAEPAAEAIEYNGYRIRPTPYPSKGAYQTAGIIEKEIRGDRYRREGERRRMKGIPFRPRRTVSEPRPSDRVFDPQGPADDRRAGRPHLPLGLSRRRHLRSNYGDLLFSHSRGAMMSRLAAKETVPETPLIRMS